MPRASLMISRTTTCDAQSARGAVAKLDSSARHAPSRPTLSRLPCAALRAAPSSTPPKSQCSNERGDTRQESPPRGGGRSARSGLRQRSRIGDICELTCRTLGPVTVNVVGKLPAGWHTLTSPCKDDRNPSAELNAATLHSFLQSCQSQKFTALSGLSFSRSAEGLQNR